MLEGGMVLQVVVLTCIWRGQEELLGGRPRSVAVTTRLYSPLSDWLRGEEERRSPVLGSKVKRSALGPGGVTRSEVKGSSRIRPIVPSFPKPYVDPILYTSYALYIHRGNIDWFA